MKIAPVCIASLVLGCSPSPPTPPPPQMPVVAQPAPSVPAQPPLGPVAPGQYTNHVGNPAAGQWGPDGQWQWKDPNSEEANSTWKYLAAAGAGAAVGGLASYMLTRKQFEKENPKGWSAESSTRQVSTYTDKRGNPISKDEYERRRAQSERDRARYHEQKRAQQSQQAQQQKQQQQYRDKHGRFISKQEYERRQAQSARDKQRQQPKPSKPSTPKRSRSRRRR